MLEQFFGSQTRVQILTLFVMNPDKRFYVREISRITGQYINSVRRELANLERFGFLKSKDDLKRRYYFVNKSFFLFNEIKELFLKAKVFLENDLTNNLKKCGDIKLIVFSGSFTGADTSSDLLIVGDNVDTKKLRFVLENFGISHGQEIKYTLFDTNDYKYRKDISDSFLHNIFSNKHIVLVDKL